MRDFFILKIAKREQRKSNYKITLSETKVSLRRQKYMRTKDQGTIARIDKFVCDFSDKYG